MLLQEERRSVRKATRERRRVEARRRQWRREDWGARRRDAGGDGSGRAARATRDSAPPTRRASLNGRADGVPQEVAPGLVPCVAAAAASAWRREVCDCPSRPACRPLGSRRRSRSDTSCHCQTRTHWTDGVRCASALVEFRQPEPEVAVDNDTNGRRCYRRSQWVDSNQNHLERDPIEWSHKCKNAF